VLAATDTVSEGKEDKVRHLATGFAVLAVCLMLLPAVGDGWTVTAEAAPPTSGGSGEIEALLLMCNSYGANYNLVRDVMELYGWNLTTVGVTATVTPCYWGGPITVDSLVTEISDVSQYDCLVVMPATAAYGHQQLIDSPDALALVSDAASQGVLVVAFCSGTRVLAAADVLNGVEVTGHPDYLQDYLDAGAIWAGGDVPPVLDGNILTTRRGQYYSPQVCEIMRTAIDSLRASE
jgi:putative intracellular protease/amidase